MAKREAEDGVAGILEEASSMPFDMGSGMGKGNKKNALGMATNEANLADLQKEMDKMKIGAAGPPVTIPAKNTMQS